MSRLINVGVKDFEKASYNEKQLKELYDKLSKIDENYSSLSQSNISDFDMPKDLGLEKIQVETVSEQELKKIADSLAEQEYSDNIKKLENQFDDNQKNYDYLTKKNQKSLQEQNSLIEELYNDRKNNAENSALKRGLARSSIIMNQIENFDKQSINEKLEASGKSQDFQNELESQIAKVKQEFLQAKDNADSKKQSQAVEKLNELLQKQQSKVNEAIKFNNDVKLKEGEYAKVWHQEMLKRVKEEIDLKNKIDAWGDSQTEKNMLQDKVSTIKQYLDGLPKEQALKILDNDDIVKQQLGNFHKVVRAFYSGEKI